VPPARAAWAVDLLLHFATSTAAEQGIRHRAADADEEEDALAEALREAPASTFPQIAGRSAGLASSIPRRLVRQAAIGNPAAVLGHGPRPRG
jgi:hypothetical protein